MTDQPGPATPKLFRDRTQRALAAAVTIAREHGLKVTEPTVLADYYSVAIHLKPAPVVARVSTLTAQLRDPIELWLEREIAVTSYLSGKGAPVVAPSPELPLQPHLHDGLTVTFWTHLQAEPGRKTTMADCAALLGELHKELKVFPEELPILSSVEAGIQKGLAVLPRTGDLLSEAEIARLPLLASELRPFQLQPGTDLRPLHGDAHPGNLIVTKDGPVWIDFEDVCLGPSEWDLVLLHWFDPDAVAKYFTPDPDLLAKCSRLQALHLSMCLLAFHDEFKDDKGYRKNVRWTLDKALQGT